MVVQELIDALHDRGVGAAKIGGRERKWKREGARGSTPEADVGGDLFAADQGDVLDEECSHPFFLPVRRAGIMPQAREVGGEA